MLVGESGLYMSVVWFNTLLWIRGGTTLVPQLAISEVITQLYSLAARDWNASLIANWGTCVVTSSDCGYKQTTYKPPLSPTSSGQLLCNAHSSPGGVGRVLVDEFAREVLGSSESGRLRLIRDGEVAFLLNLRERWRRLRLVFSGSVAICTFSAASA